MEHVEEVVLVRPPLWEPAAEGKLSRAGIDERVEDVRLEVDAGCGGGVGGGDGEGEVEDRAGEVAAMNEDDAVPFWAAVSSSLAGGSKERTH